jgi:hypothetical protein
MLARLLSSRFLRTAQNQIRKARRPTRERPPRPAPTPMPITAPCERPGEEGSVEVETGVDVEDCVIGTTVTVLPIVTVVPGAVDGGAGVVLAGVFVVGVGLACRLAVAVAVGRVLDEVTVVVIIVVEVTVTVELAPTVDVMVLVTRTPLVT